MGYLLLERDCENSWRNTKKSAIHGDANRGFLELPFCLSA
jgi:hypothetical protein